MSVRFARGAGARWGSRSHFAHPRTYATMADAFSDLRARFAGVAVRPELTYLENLAEAGIYVWLEETS